MYAKLEEDFGLARRSMSIFDRATHVVADEDKFEVCLARTDLCHCLYTLQMFTIYIAKATANYGLPATRPIYERALEGTFILVINMQHS
jgi:pre-mRNA-splicing factor SYF1